MISDDKSVWVSPQEAAVIIRETYLAKGVDLSHERILEFIAQQCEMGKIASISLPEPHMYAHPELN